MARFATLQDSLCGRPSLKQCRGFGLVELMIALALGMVIILGVTTLFSDSSRTLNDITRAGRQLENSLYAMDLLAKELSLVDYWGEANAPVDADDPAYGPLRAGELNGLEISGYPQVPPLCPGTGATGFDPRVELAWAMEYPLLAGLGSEVNAAVGDGSCKGGGSTASATAAYFAARRASTCAVGDTEASKDICRGADNFFYMQTNGCYDENKGLSGGELKLYPLDSDTFPGGLDYTRYSCESADAAPIYRYVSRIYYVNASDQLVRLSLDKPEDEPISYQQEILVDGVEDLQFEWFIDDTGDGQYNRVDTTLAYEDAVNVIGAKIWLMVRSSRERPGYVDDTVYTMAGKEWLVPEGMSGYPRTLQSRTVNLPNRVGRRR